MIRVVVIIKTTNLTCIIRVAKIEAYYDAKPMEIAG